MKKMVKAWIVLGLVALVAFNTSYVSVTAAAPKEVQLRFSWWGNDSRHKATLKAIEAYTKKNPNVKIMAEYGGFDTYYQKLLTQLAGGTAADIIQIDYKWVDDLAAQGRLFVDMAKMSKQIDMTGFDMKFVKDHCASGNYILGLPMGVSVFGLIGNSALLKQAGIDIDTKWDWDNLVDAGVKMQKFDKNKHLLFMKNIHYYYLVKTMLKQKTGKDFISDKYAMTFTRKDLVDVFSYIRKLVDLGVVPPLEESVLFENGGPDQNTNWLSGKYGFCADQAGKLTGIISASKFELGVARFPVAKVNKNPGLTTSPSQIMSINSKSANVAESAKFVNWFLNDPEAAVILGDNRGLPAVDKVRQLLMKDKMIEPLMVKMVDITLPFSGGAENVASLNQEIESIIEEYVQQVGFKRMTPEKAADAMIKDLNGKLAELKKS
jgi:oligogalacturonide transport system substrate-binding protein